MKSHEWTDDGMSSQILKIVRNVLVKLIKESNETAWNQNIYCTQSIIKNNEYVP